MQKHEPQASVFSISRVYFSNAPRFFITVSNTRLRLLHLLYDMAGDHDGAKNSKTRFFYVLYSDETWVFDQLERAQGPGNIIMN